MGNNIGNGSGGERRDKVDVSIFYRDDPTVGHEGDVPSKTQGTSDSYDAYDRMPEDGFDRFDESELPEKAHRNPLLSIADDLKQKATDIYVQRYIVDCLLRENASFINIERWYKITQTALRLNDKFMTWCVLTNWPEAHSIYAEDGDTKFIYDGLQIHIKTDETSGIKIVVEIPDSWALSAVEPFEESERIKRLIKLFELSDSGASWRKLADLWFDYEAEVTDERMSPVAKFFNWFKPFGGRNRLAHVDRTSVYHKLEEERSAYERRKSDSERIRNYVVSNIARIDANRMLPFTTFADGISLCYQVGATEYTQREWNDFRANLIGTSSDWSQPDAIGS